MSEAVAGRREQGKLKTFVSEADWPSSLLGTATGLRLLTRASFLFDLGKPTMRLEAGAKHKSVSSCSLLGSIPMMSLLRPGRGAVSRQCMSFLFTC